MSSNMPDLVTANPGQGAAVLIVIHLLCILLAWWAVQSIRFELFLRDVKSPQARVLQIILAVSLGTGLASFISSYYGWSTLLKWLA